MQAGRRLAKHPQKARLRHNQRPSPVRAPRGADAETAALLAAAIGGLWIGLVHQSCGNLARGLLNGCLQIPSYAPAPMSEFGLHLLEFIQIDAPVYGAFCGSYAMRGSFMEAIKPVGAGIAAIAASKTGASMVGGFLQGMVTDLINQGFTAANFMKETAAAPGKGWREDMRASMAKLSSDMTGRKLGHDFTGKIIGGLGGNLLALLVSPSEFGSISTHHGANEGAAGMADFLGGWFGGIHGGAIFGKLHDWCTTPTPPPGDGQSVVTTTPAEIERGEAPRKSDEASIDARRKLDFDAAASPGDRPRRIISGSNAGSRDSSPSTEESADVEEIRESLKKLVTLRDGMFGIANNCFNEMGLSRPNPRLLNTFFESLMVYLADNPARRDMPEIDWNGIIEVAEYLVGHDVDDIHDLAPKVFNTEDDFKTFIASFLTRLSGRDQSDSESSSDSD